MAHPLELLPEQVFAGQFRVIRPLAVGGMGAVYVVEQLSTGKRRALKLMLPQAARADGVRRFEQEARVSALIQSEHVVDVIATGVDEAEGTPWLAMELLEGESLEQYLERVGVPPLAESYEILEQLAHALGAAHDIGVVHRDLKPDNVFLAASRSAGSAFLLKVLDYGIAKQVSLGASNTAAIGSPMWMAPEQTQLHAKLSCATDVWAFGLIAFRLLTGQNYWRSLEGSLANWLREALVDPMSPPSLRCQELGVSELPPGFDDWFARAVARAPEARFQHGRDAWLALAEVLRRSPALPSPSRRSLSDPASRDAKRTISIHPDAAGGDPTLLSRGVTPPSASRELPGPAVAPVATTRAKRGRWGISVLVLALAAAAVFVWLRFRPSPAQDAPLSSFTAESASPAASPTPIGQEPAAPEEPPQPALLSSTPASPATAPSAALTATARPKPSKPSPKPAGSAAPVKASPPANSIPDLL